MSIGKDLDYTARIREVKGVQFSILGGDEIKRRSVCHVQETILYDSRGEPVINGLMDPRMGVNDHGKICPTDGLDNKFCPAGLGALAITVNPPPVTAPATTAYLNRSAERLSILKSGTCEAKKVIAALSLKAVNITDPMKSVVSLRADKTGDIHHPCKPP